MTDPLAVASDLTDFQASDPDAMIGAAEALVRTYCGWHISPSQDDTATLWVSGSLVSLPTLYLTAVESVTVYPTPLSSAQLLVVNDDYRWDENGLIILNTHCSVYVQQRVVVEFTHGYPTTPPELRAAILSLAAVQPFSTGVAQSVGQVSYRDGFDRLGTLHQQVIDRYRIPART